MNDNIQGTPVNPVPAVPVPVTPAQAAVEAKKDFVAKEQSDKNAVRRTQDGFEYKLHSVAANTLREAQTKIPDAKIRTFTNPTTGLEENNPVSPDYVLEQAQVSEARTKASMNALLLFGLELVDPIPADNAWLKKLAYTNLITQAEYDEATGVDGGFLRELFYKNYMIADLDILNELSRMAGVTREDIAKARKSFQGTP